MRSQARRGGGRNHKESQEDSVDDDEAETFLSALFWLPDCLALVLCSSSSGADEIKSG